MRILLRAVIACPPDAAWALLTTPAGMRSVAAPLLDFRSLEPGGFPARWPEGSHTVELLAFGVLPVGRQTVDISFERRGDARTGTRIVHDTGQALSWPLTLTTRWHHRMAVSGTPGGSTLFRDELRFSAGVLTPVLWLGYWVFWQWRLRGIIRLAREAGAGGGS